MTREMTFECVCIDENGERHPDAFYGVDYAEARARADRDIANGGCVEVIFDCEL